MAELLHGQRGESPHSGNAQDLLAGDRAVHIGGRPGTTQTSDAMALRSKSKYVPAAKPASNAGVTLYCTDTGTACHWVRLVLCEKDVPGVRVRVQRPAGFDEDLATINPMRSLPTLTDRETVIYPARLIAEFLDERYPHPPMMPPEASARARLRMAMQQLEQEWMSLVGEVESGAAAAARAARKQLGDRLAASARLFPSRGWFLGLEYGIADCAWAALLWRLGSLKMQMPAGTDPIRRYAERVFARPAFATSLVDAQRPAGRVQRP